MTPSQVMDCLIGEIQARFREARAKAASSEKIAHNSYGAGYDLGYSDALGELLEHIEGPDPDEPITQEKFDDLNKRAT
jgi:hypothetical protein